METIKIQSGQKKFQADLADNFLRRIKGLSFRESGKMLFVFPWNTSASIDMIFLSKPLYLYFMNEEKQIIEIQKAEPWSWNPKSWRLYSPRDSYRYLLESFDPLDLEEGDKLVF